MQPHYGSTSGQHKFFHEIMILAHYRAFFIFTISTHPSVFLLYDAVIHVIERHLQKPPDIDR